MAARAIVGNIRLTGYVNMVYDTYFLVGTGHFMSKGEKQYKESVTVFLDEAYKGYRPEKGNYIEVRADLVVAPRKNKPDELATTMNVRFDDQITKLEEPKRSSAAADDADKDI